MVTLHDALVSTSHIVITMASLILVYGAYKFMYVIWLRRNFYARIAKAQGIEGPNPSLVWGNCLDMKRFKDEIDASDKSRMELDPEGWCLYESINVSHKYTASRILPEHVVWSAKHGVKRRKSYLMWFGPVEPEIVSMDMDVVKDALLMPSTILRHIGNRMDTAFEHSKNNNNNNHNHYHQNNNDNDKKKRDCCLPSNMAASLAMGKSPMLQRYFNPIAGLNGLGLTNGITWANQRRAISPIFHSTRLKEFSQSILTLTISLAESWCRDIEVQESGGGIEIEMEACMTSLASSAIERVLFGSYNEQGARALQHVIEIKRWICKHGHLLLVPGMSYLPLPILMKLRKLKRAFENSIQEIIEDRQSSPDPDARFDMLGLMLGHGETYNFQEIVDQCKGFFFAGHDTTALLMTWALQLLAHNTYWQDCARLEVFDVDMILHETLRLFPPGNATIRAALHDVQLGDLFVPKGMSIRIPILAIHLDPELWGDTVYDFNPGRFANGTSKAAKHPMAFLPFVHGARNCLGQNFAMMETKLVLATLLSKFSFLPSPSYKHAPEMMITIRPKYGAPIIVKRIALP